MAWTRSRVRSASAPPPPSRAPTGGGAGTVVVPFLDEHLPASHKREQYLAWRAELLDYWRDRARRRRPCTVDGCDEPGGRRGSAALWSDGGRMSREEFLAGCEQPAAGDSTYVVTDVLIVSRSTDRVVAEVTSISDEGPYVEEVVFVNEDGWKVDEVP